MSNGEKSAILVVREVIKLAVHAPFHSQGSLEPVRQSLHRILKLDAIHINRTGAQRRSPAFLQLYCAS